MVVDQFTQTQVLGQGGRKNQPGVCHQPMIVEGADAVGVIACSICWVLPSWGRFGLTKPLSQIQRSTFLPLQDTHPTPAFGGFGLRKSGAQSGGESSLPT